MILENKDIQVKALLDISVAFSTKGIQHSELLVFVIMNWEIWKNRNENLTWVLATNKSQSLMKNTTMQHRFTNLNEKYDYATQVHKPQQMKI